MLDRGQSVNVFAYACAGNLIDKSCIFSLSLFRYPAFQQDCLSALKEKAAV